MLPPFLRQLTQYSNANPVFSWALPSTITGVNVLADRVATTDPGTRSDGRFASYDYDDVDEGNWFFHIRLENENGWGPVSHFAFNIDAAAPTVTALVQDGEPQRILVTGIDELSGIAQYGFMIDGGAEIVWVDDGTHEFVLPALEVGEHTVVVTAYDQAGNTATSTVTVTGTGLEVAPPPVEEVVLESVEVSWVLTWFLYLVLYIILLLALLAVFVVLWKIFHHASKYKLVIVKREPKRKDPYRHIHRKFLKLFEKTQKKADRRRQKGIVTKTGRRSVDKELEALLQDVIDHVHDMRMK
jgi:hypothetical protein